MGKRFEGKVAVVTGAANGIGHCIVCRLLEEGAKVAALDIEGDTLAREFEGNEDIAIYPLDVADYTMCNKVVDEVLETYGHIDILFSNAGIINVGVCRARPRRNGVASSTSTSMGVSGWIRPWQSQ